MANFFNLQNVSYPEYYSHRRTVSFDRICPRCHWSDSRSIEVPYVRDDGGHSERVRCGGRCSNDNFVFNIHVQGSNFD
jgi:hypothetical protein